jgi:hypothetical protein
MVKSVRVTVTAGDAMTVEADVLALKFAQAFYGVDKKVALRLANSGPVDVSPPDGAVRLVPGRGVVSATQVLFVGLPGLYEVGYREIRDFAARALSSLAKMARGTRVLALTLHGPGYGLDEKECFASELAGIAEAVVSGRYPDELETVRIVELDERRAVRLRGLLDGYLPDGRIDVATGALRSRIGEERSETLRAAGYESEQKPHIFVAMPFSDEMGDLFHYGIQQAISASGYLCERIDQLPSVGDVLARIKERIKTSAFVVADLTGGSPNVYLEVGYAWGCGVPTVLLVQKNEVASLRFDIAGQRCIVYSSIRDLEQKLSAELAGLSGTADRSLADMPHGPT